MSEIDWEEIESLCQTNSVMSEKEFGRVLQYLEKSQDAKIKSFPFLIKCNENGIDIEKFINFILGKIVYYVFKHSEYSRDGKILSEDDDEIKKLVPLAIARFAKKHPNTGELGELILFLLLESFGIIQIVNKMIMKGNPEEFFKGSDADHIQINGKKIALHFGESKMHANFDGGLAKAIKDTKKFISSQEKFEINSTISAHMDDSKFDDNVEELHEFLFPYNETEPKYEKIHSIFIGYDWKLLESLESGSADTLDLKLKTEFLEEFEKLSSKIKTKISSSGINDRTFDFYIIPFRSVDEARKLFVEELKNGE